jgi:hypothetical protein
MEQLMSTFADTRCIKTAVVTGNHAFDVPAFHAMLRSLPDVDFYLQDLANLIADTQGAFDGYDMRDCGDDSQVLLTTDHPKSMRTIAWARTFRRSRVLCTASGHDHVTYADPHFRRFLGRGIQWVAGRV